MADVLQLSMSIDPQGELLDAARECESEVFLNTFGNTSDQWQHEYGPYEDCSIFVALHEPGGDAIAACRILVPSDIGLKTLDDTSRSPWFVDGYRSARAAGIDVARTMDIATIGVRRNLRGTGMIAATALYYAIGALSRHNGLPYIVMIHDEHARALLTSVGCISHVLPGTHVGEYLGSQASTPVWMHLPTMFDNQRRINPDGYRLINKGIGLDGLTLPSPEDFELRARMPVAESVLEVA